MTTCIVWVSTRESACFPLLPSYCSSRANRPPDHSRSKTHPLTRGASTFLQHASERTRASSTDSSPGLRSKSSSPICRVRFRLRVNVLLQLLQVNVTGSSTVIVVPFPTDYFSFQNSHHF